MKKGIISIFIILLVAMIVYAFMRAGSPVPALVQ